jgi:hypothetical protein
MHYGDRCRSWSHPWRYNLYDSEVHRPFTIRIIYYKRSKVFKIGAIEVFDAWWAEKGSIIISHSSSKWQCRATVSTLTGLTWNGTCFPSASSHRQQGLQGVPSSHSAHWNHPQSSQMELHCEFLDSMHIMVTWLWSHSCPAPFPLLITDTERARFALTTRVHLIAGTIEQSYVNVIDFLLASSKLGKLCGQTGYNQNRNLFLLDCACSKPADNKILLCWNISWYLVIGDFVKGSSFAEWLRGRNQNLFLMDCAGLKPDCLFPIKTHLDIHSWIVSLEVSYNWT